MTNKHRFLLSLVVMLMAAGLFASAVYARHSWRGYHWARTANPFALKLGDNVSFAWDAYLGEASSDWNSPLGGWAKVLDTTVVPGGTGSLSCAPTLGRVEVCNDEYGNNGWLGIASIWLSGRHITKGTAKMNDTYFTTAPYNATYDTPPWHRLVMCQEVAHTFGLGHQDERFNNVNLGSCMDYTNDPDGGPGGASATDPSNEHPNTHDFEQLVKIYGHADTITTVGQTILGRGAFGDTEDAAEWSRSLQQDGQGKTSLYVRDLGNGEKMLTFIFWAE